MLPLRFSFCSRRFYKLKILLDRDTNKCFDKDLTKYLDKYQYDLEHCPFFSKYKKISSAAFHLTISMTFLIWNLKYCG